MASSADPNFEPKPANFGPLAILAIAVGVAFSIAKAVVWSGGFFTAEALGYALGAMLLPALIAYAIAGRRKVRNPRLFSLSFCGICFILLLMELSTRPVSWKQHVGDLIRQAATQSTPSAAASANPQMDDVIRDMVRSILELRRSHDAEVARFSPDLDRLYSPESFSSPASIRRTLDAVHGVLSADVEFSHQFKQWQERVEAQVNRSAMSVNDREDFMKGFRRSLGDSKILATREKVVETETRWADSTSDLYNFALRKLAKLKIKDSRMVIADENVRKQFNQKLADSQRIRKDLQELNSQIEALQREGMQQVGVTPKDLGLDRDKAH